MRNSVPADAVRTPANPRRAEQLDGIKAGDANVRMTANFVENRPEKRELLREAARRLGLSQKAMALNAGQPESVISDALNGRRSFDVEWERSQPAAFRRMVRQLEDAAEGIDPASQRRQSFEDFIELARAFWFRHERREERRVS